MKRFEILDMSDLHQDVIKQVKLLESIEKTFDASDSHGVSMYQTPHSLFSSSRSIKTYMLERGHVNERRLI